MNILNKLRKPVKKRPVGCSVTQRITQIKQPVGGYVNPNAMTITQLNGGIDDLNPEENISPTLVGLTVDYLTRFMSGKSAKDAFRISLMGAKIINEERKSLKLLSSIRGLDDKSILCAVKLCGFDVCYRSSTSGYRSVNNINANAATVENIRTMVKRSLTFFRKYGPVILDGFTFKGGYTDVVSTGDGDFTTTDTLWDFKVSKAKPKKEHTLQLLMYWRMGLHSIHPEFKRIKYLGIYNPRLNIVCRLDVTEIPHSVIEEIEHTVLGYKQ